VGLFYFQQVPPVADLISNYHPGDEVIFPDIPLHLIHSDRNILDFSFWFLEGMGSVLTRLSSHLISFQGAYTARMVAMFIVRSLFNGFFLPVISLSTPRAKLASWTAKIWTALPKYLWHIRNVGSPITRTVCDLTPQHQRGNFLEYFALDIAALDKQLAPWNSHESPGKRRADSDHDTFSVK
jgi:hypothetical protein